MSHGTPDFEFRVRLGSSSLPISVHAGDHLDGLPVCTCVRVSMWGIVVVSGKTSQGCARGVTRCVAA